MRMAPWAKGEKKITLIDDAEQEWLDFKKLGRIATSGIYIDFELKKRE